MISSKPLMYLCPSSRIIWEALNIYFFIPLQTSVRLSLCLQLPWFVYSHDVPEPEFCSGNPLDKRLGLVPVLSPSLRPGPTHFSPWGPDCEGVISLLFSPLPSVIWCPGQELSTFLVQLHILSSFSEKPVLRKDLINSFTFLKMKAKKTNQQEQQKLLFLCM